MYFVCSYPSPRSYALTPEGIDFLAIIFLGGDSDCDDAGDGDSGGECVVGWGTGGTDTKKNKRCKWLRFHSHWALSYSNNRHLIGGKLSKLKLWTRIYIGINERRCTSRQNHFKMWSIYWVMSFKALHTAERLLKIRLLIRLQHAWLVWSLNESIVTGYKRRILSGSKWSIFDEG